MTGDHKHQNLQDSVSMAPFLTGVNPMLHEDEDISFLSFAASSLEKA